MYLLAALSFLFILRLCIIELNKFESEVPSFHYGLALTSTTMLTLWGIVFVFANNQAMRYFAAFSVFAYKVTKTRLNHARETLNSTPTHSTCHQMNNFIVQHTKTLQFVFYMNRATRSIFLLFILTNLPLNTTTLASISLNLVRSVTMVVFYVWYCMFQMTIIFCVHWLGSKYASHIHQSMPRLISCSLMNLRFVKLTGRRVDLHSTVKIGNYIQAMHTRKRYGMTYASFGLVTMMSFAKVSPLIRLLS